MGVEYYNDEALRELDDLVEYDPTEINTSPQSSELLSKIAGGDYWKHIVSRYNKGEITGYKAEKIFSNEYKERLKKQFSYVLDMPIRLKPGHRPKYRMIHACNHEDGCFIMAQNMHQRKDELFTCIQQNNQMSLLSLLNTVASTVENEFIAVGEIEKLLALQLSNINGEIRLKKFLAEFFNENGLLCEFGMLNKILDQMKHRGQIDIIRTPSTTSTGKPSMFWDEKEGKRITIRRLRP
jgi:hypothetical protein